MKKDDWPQHHAGCALLEKLGDQCTCGALPASISVWPTSHGEVRITNESGATLYVGVWEGIKTVFRLIFKGHKVQVKE
jgi:hypothetical protein